MKTPESLLHDSANRWEQRAEIREKNRKGIQENKISQIESPERILKRINHLTKISSKPLQGISQVNFTEGFTQEIGLERVIGKDDFLGINFLEHGLAVSRSVCKVNIFRSQGSFAGSGTGFMIAPNLIMTNNHVLPNSDLATFSILEFDYQLDKKGNIQPSVFFKLEPSNFFITDEALDYTIVAVSSISQNSNIQLTNYGWNKLMDEGKALIGDPLNIIQHPNGGYKQIVLQSNELIDLLPIHAHYLTDTEPGSSGSLVCNNQWEVVALHHAGVPKRRNGKIIDINDNPWNGQNASDIDWIANEGIRISRILRDLENKNISSDWENLRTSIFETTPPDPIELYNQCSIPIPSTKIPNDIVRNSNSITWNVPLSITVSMGDITQQNNPNNQVVKLKESPNVINTNLGRIGVEKNVIPYMDPDYSTRKGYDENYLGIKVELPKIIDVTKTSKMENGDFVLPYHHFSLVMNKERRLAYFCASNVDGRENSKRPDKEKKYSRKILGGLGKNDREAWLTDPRIPAVHQLPDKFYNKDRKSFDKGHIIRRDDVAWGKTYEEVRISNGDTFHTTNCSPQVANYNRSNLSGIWGKFENHILKEAKDEKLIVFSGPIFRKNDRFFDGFDDRGKIRVKIPKSFWKVVVSRVGSSLVTFAFVFKQNLKNVDWDEAFSTPEKFVKHQLKLIDLEKQLYNIEFPKLLIDSDQMK